MITIIERKLKKKNNATEKKKDEKILRNNLIYTYIKGQRSI